METMLFETSLFFFPSSPSFSSSSKYLPGGSAGRIGNYNCYSMHNSSSFFAFNNGPSLKFSANAATTGWDDTRAQTSILFSQMAYLNQYYHLCSTHNYLRKTQWKMNEALSKRIHYGKFVAEAKFRASPDIYTAAIKEQDKDQLMNLLTYQAVEDAVKKRVEVKAETFGEEVSVNPTVDVTEPAYKIKPDIVADLYGCWIMPLTKEVQVDYLLRRLD